MLFRNLARRICGFQLRSMAYSNVPQSSAHLKQELELQFSTAMTLMKLQTGFDLAKTSFEKAIETSLILYQAEPHKACDILSEIAGHYVEKRLFNEALSILQNALKFIEGFQITENSTKNDKDLIQKSIWQLNHQIGEIYCFISDFPNSDKYLSKHIDVIKFPSQFQEAVSYNRLAYIKVQLQDKEALKYAEKAMNLCKIVAPTDHFFGVCLCTLAYSYNLFGNFITAEKTLREGIEFLEKTNAGIGVLDSINACEYLVEMLLTKHRFDEAASLIIKICTSMAKYSDERKKYLYLKGVVPKIKNHSAVRPVLEMLLDLCKFVPEDLREQNGFHILMVENLVAFGENKEALAYAEKCLTLVKNSNQNELYSCIYIAMSIIYLNLEDFDKFKSYLDLCEPLIKQYPDNSVECALNYHKYIHYSRQREYTEAEKYLKISIDKAKATFAAPDLLSYRYLELGNLYQANNKLDKALDSFNIAFELTTKNFGSKTTEAANCMERIGTLYNIQHNFNASLEFLFGALEIRTELCGEHGQELITTYYQIAKVYFTMKENPLALEYAEKLPSLIKKYEEEDSIDLTSSYLLIAHIYAALMNQKKSKEMYIMAKEIYLRFDYKAAVDFINEKIAGFNY